MDSEDLLIFLAGITVGTVVTLIVVNRPQTQAQTPSPIATNKETWEWIDWKGRKRSITVHREVESR